MPGEVNPDTNFKVIDKHSPETQARVAGMSREDHIGDVNEMVLKLCPFCGGEAGLGLSFGEDTYPECPKCDVTWGLYRTEQEAVAAWNRRTPEPGTSVVRWVNADKEKPDSQKRVLICALYENALTLKMQRYITIAKYIPPRTVLAEDFLDTSQDCFDELVDFDNAEDVGYVKEGWFQDDGWDQDISMQVDNEVIAWAYLPEPPETDA